MKISVLLSLFLLVIIFVLHKHDTSLPRKIVFIGDSITYGSTLNFPEKESFPALLNKKLPSSFIIKNLGVPGAMLSLIHPFSFCKTKAYFILKGLSPDLVFIMLGTNDSSLSKKELKLDYSFNYLISEIRKLNQKVKIIYIIPPTIPAKDIPQDELFLKEEIIPKLKKLCDNENIPFIDSHNFLDQIIYFSKDKLHLNNKGHEKLAEKIYPLIQN